VLGLDAEGLVGGRFTTLNIRLNRPYGGGDYLVEASGESLGVGY